MAMEGAPWGRRRCGKGTLPRGGMRNAAAVGAQTVSHGARGLAIGAGLAARAARTAWRRAHAAAARFAIAGRIRYNGPIVHPAGSAQRAGRRLAPMAP
jgi:hypothetical protein